MANLNENRRLMESQIKSLRNLTESTDISSKVAKSIAIALDDYVKTVNDYKYGLPAEGRHLPKLIDLIFRLDKEGYTDLEQLASNIIKHLDHYAKQKIDADTYGLPIDNNQSMKKMISIVVKLIK